MPISRGHQIVVSLLRQNCPPSGTIVDVGAWPGTLTRHLRALGWNVVAVDKQPDRGESLARQYALGGPSLDAMGGNLCFAENMRSIGVEVKAADVETMALPFEADSVDAVTLTEVIEHLWMDPIFALSEINRVLKPATGVLILSTPNFSSLRNRINFFRGRIDRVIESPFVSYLKRSRLGHLGHLRLYAPAELRTILHLLGFRASFHFHSLNYWEPAAEDGPAGGNGADTRARSSRFGGVVRRVARLPRKLVRSPKSYLDATAATALSLFEKALPTVRQHMFVVATKVSDADYERNCPDLLKSLMEANVATLP